MKNGNEMISFIQRKIHLVDNLKTNMLVGNDITDPESFSINMAKKHAIVESTDASISLNVRSPKVAVHRLIHLRSTTVIPPHVEMAIPVHNVNLFASRNFLFEPNNDIELAMYAHFVDANTTAIVVRNEKSVPVKIPRNFRLGKMSELDFPNAFHIKSADEDGVRHLAVKKPKSTHQNG